MAYSETGEKELQERSENACRDLTTLPCNYPSQYTALSTHARMRERTYSRTHALTHTNKMVHRKRIYKYHITITKKLEHGRVPKTVLQEVLRGVKHGDESAINGINKLSATGITQNNFQAFNSNTSFFIPRQLKVHDSRSVLSDSLLESLMQYLYHIEESEQKGGLGHTLSDSCANI